MKDRLRAAGFHLLWSILVVGGIATLMVSVWYPPELQRLVGGYALIFTMAAIDIAAGPLLTLVVFDRSKRYLKLDLALILAAQIAFLGYGVYAAAESRPVYVVAVVDQFHLVTANEIDEAALLASEGSGYESLPWTGPRLVAAKPPADDVLREALLWDAVSGRDIHLQPQFYIPYEQAAAAVMARGGMNRDQLQAALPPTALERLTEPDASASPITYLWLVSKRGVGVAKVDARSAELRGFADLLGEGG